MVLLKEIKKNRLSKEVLYLIDRINDESSYYRIDDYEFDIIDNKYTKYTLFNINTEGKTIDIMKWNIFIIFDSILSRDISLSDFVPSDEDSILLAIKNSKLSDYKII